jgi:hypothetical protein
VRYYPLCKSCLEKVEWTGQGEKPCTHECGFI